MNYPRNSLDPNVLRLFQQMMNNGGPQQNSFPTANPNPYFTPIDRPGLGHQPSNPFARFPNPPAAPAPTFNQLLSLFATGAGTSHSAVGQPGVSNVQSAFSFLTTPASTLNDKPSTSQDKIPSTRASISISKKPRVSRVNMKKDKVIRERNKEIKVKPVADWEEDQKEVIEVIREPVPIESNLHKFISSKTVPNKKEFNILIIGETGVGKSTWINGIANYIMYGSLEEALRGDGPLCLIPMSFIWEEDVKTLIQMRPSSLKCDGNEVESDRGQSCTQAPKIFRFVTDAHVFNLIDTPGIGDTRGVLADIENTRRIMKCVSSFEKIHSICLLLKPNLSRSTQTLRFCLFELLTNLHKNCIRNLSVVFTNACGTHYRPAETLTVLRGLCEDVKQKTGHGISFTNKNTFCIDNMGIRMLCAHQKGVRPGRDKVLISSNAWAQTSKETFRLFERVLKASPHWADQTKVTSIVRSISDEMCRVLTETRELMEQKEIVLTESEKARKSLEKRLEENQKASEHKGKYLLETALASPNVVCMGTKCHQMELDPVSNSLKSYHPKVCQVSCTMEGVAMESMTDVNLRPCPIFDSTGICSVCSCSWQSHLLLPRSQEIKEGPIQLNITKDEDERLTAQLQDKISQIEKCTKRIIELKKDFQKGQVMIQPYANFLQDHSIIPENETFSDYVRLSIKEAKESLRVEVRETVAELETLLKFTEQRKLLMVATNERKDALDFGNYEKQFNLLKESSPFEDLKDSIVCQSLFESSTFKVIEVSPREGLVTKKEVN